MKKEFKGLITSKYSGGEGDGIYIIPTSGGFDKAFAYDFPSREQVSVRYAISTTGIWPETLGEVAADELSLLEGKSESVYGAQYSEITGYLWTDEEAKVGGHDLIAMLENNIGKYLWMEVRY